MKASSADRHDVCPALYVALASPIIAHGHHCAVRLQAYCMPVVCADRLPVGDLFPDGETPFPRSGIIAKLSIQDGRRAQISCRFHGFCRCKANCLRAFRRIFIVACGLERRCRAIVVARREQFLRPGIVYRLYALWRVLIIPSQRKLCKSTVGIACRQ